MTKTVHAIFDGKVFCPKEPVDFEVNGHYILQIQPEVHSRNSEIESDPAFDLSSIAVKTEIPNLAAEHDHYLYGVPKRDSDD